MNRNYIIFFWIICLILFTFYCVFRLKYLSDTSYKNRDTIRHKQEQYEDVPLNTPTLTAYTGDVIVTRDPITTEPIVAVTQANDFITYIENIQAKDKISDMLNCDTLYDDNLKVKELGYKTCGDAYADYLDKNYDVNNKYGNPYTLTEICPIASKSDEYQECLQLLLTKFTDSVQLLDGVNTDMTTSINSRLNLRTDDLYKIQASINPFIYNKVQNDFKNDMLTKNQIAYRTDDKLNLVNKYYQNRYQLGIETFTNYNKNTNINTNTNTNTNTVEPFTNIILPDIETLFFGKYKTVRGQFENLSDLVFTIEYDDSDDNIFFNMDYDMNTDMDNVMNKNKPTNMNTNSTQPSTMTQTTKASSLSQPTTASSLSQPTTASSLSQPTSAQSKSAQPTSLSQLSPLSVIPETRPVIFTLRNNDIYIKYSVTTINFYKLNEKTIKLILSNKNIVHQVSPTNIVEPLLTHLGLYSPSSIILTFDTYTSTEKVKHDTYRLVNDNLDTILVLYKIPNPKTTNSTPTNSTPTATDSS